MPETPLSPDLTASAPDDFVPLVPPAPDEYAPPPAPPAPCNNTAHQFAAWLAVYRPLCPAPALYPDFVGTPFPPDRSDLDALDAAWKQRLADLRAAGAAPLASQWSYARAANCRPHAFAYAGTGRPCRFWFCPYCAGAEAAELYARIRRARIKAGPGCGLYLSHARFAVPRTECRRAAAALLSRDPAAVLRVPGARPFGSFAGWRTGDDLVRVGLHPLARYHTDAARVAVSVRAVAAVPLGEVRRARAAARRQGAHVREVERRLKERAAGRPAPELDGDRGPVASPQWNAGYPVHPTPAAEARVAAHLVGYPGEVLTAPAGDAAAVLNLAAGLRQSVTRGAFRSAAPVRPGADRRYVPMTTGASLTGPLLPLVPDPDEGLAARGFARDLGLAPADTFAAVGAQLGWPCYWVGCYEFTLVEGFGVRANSRFGLMVKAARPKRPGAHHVLVSSSSIGYLVFWSPSANDHTGPNGGWDMSRLTRPVTTITNYKLRRRYYHWAPVAVFRHLALELRITGPWADPPIRAQVPVDPPSSAPSVADPVIAPRDVGHPEFDVPHDAAPAPVIC